MPEMNITVRNKIATKTDNMAYVCGNSDYVINFAFDGEWDAYDTKTARFARDGQYTDVVFTGNQCNVPVITNTYAFHVGVFAGDLHTTTAARVPCRKSILCGAGAPEDPPKNVYDQLMERMAQLETSDWAQNDPTAKDYVKNRTHYVERQQTSIAGVQIIDTPYEGTKHDPLPFALGQVWNAKFVTTHYNDLEVKQADDGTLYIGDMTVNNPPFYVSVTSGGCNKQWIRMMQPGAMTLTGVSGTMVDTTIHPIPEQYIPDTVVRKSDIPEQVQSDWNESNESSKAFIKNKPQVFKRYLFVVTPDATEVVMPGSDTLLWYNLIEISLTKGSTFSAVTFRREGSYSAPIYSQKTGQPVTKEELPYFNMLCSVINVGGYPTLLLINPR